VENILLYKIMSDTARPKSGGDLVDEDEVNADFPIVLDAGATINGATLPVPVYVLVADGELYPCDANDTAKLDFIGFVVNNTTDGNPATLQKDGVVDGFSGLTIGAMYYVQDAIGTIGSTPGTFSIPVGRAVSATQIAIQKEEFGVYIGSEAISTNEGSPTDNLTIPAGARMAIISVSHNDGVSGARNSPQMIVMRNGITDTGAITPSYQPQNDDYTHRAQWNATLDVTQGGTDATHTMAGTAYFYR